MRIEDEKSPVIFHIPSYNASAEAPMSPRCVGGTVVWLIFVWPLAWLFLRWRYLYVAWLPGVPLFLRDAWPYMPLLFGCLLAFLLYLLRERTRLVYGLLEFLVGVALIWDAIHATTGSFSSDFSADFHPAATLQSYAGLFIFIRALDNIGAGSVKFHQSVHWLCHKTWP
jgi:hypothetical protein